MKAKKITMIFDSESFTNYERISFLREMEGNNYDLITENVTQDGETEFTFIIMEHGQWKT